MITQLKTYTLILLLNIGFNTYIANAKPPIKANANPPAKQVCHFVPFIGKHEFSISNQQVIDRRMALPIYQGLPEKNYTVIGDIYVSGMTHPNIGIETAVNLAIEKGAHALIVASETEIYKQTVTGKQRLNIDDPFYRFWIIKFIGENPEVLPRPQENTEIRQLATPKLVKKGKLARITSLREELIETDRKISLAKQGVIPTGYTKQEYIKLLEQQETETILEMEQETWAQ